MSSSIPARGRLTRRTVLVGTLFGTATVLLTACGTAGPQADTAAAPAIDPNLGGGDAWQRVLDAARSEGRVVVYSANDNFAAIPAAFTAAYPGIEVQVDHFASGPLTAKLDAEAGGSASGADVAVHSSRGWWEANTGRLTPGTGPALARYWAGSPHVYAGGRYTLIGANPLGVAVNRDRAAELGTSPITTYRDLLQPALKGNVGIVPGEGSPAAEQWWFHAAREIGGKAGLDQLAGLTPRLYRSGTTPLATDVAAGEIAVGFYATAASVRALAAKGAPVDFVTVEPIIAIGGYAGIVDPTHPNAAQVFLNWMLSPGGQTVLSSGGGALTPLDRSVLGDSPDTVRSIPADGLITDGLLQPEQKAFYDGVFLPTLVAGR